MTRIRLAVPPSLARMLPQPCRARSLIIDSPIKPSTPSKPGGDSWSSDGGTLYFIAGVDRYTTAEGAAIEDTGANCCAPQDPFVGYASGDGFADALTGGAALATLHGRLFLTAPDYVPTATTATYPGPADQVKYTTYTGTVFGGAQPRARSSSGGCGMRWRSSTPREPRGRPCRSVGWSGRPTPRRC